MSATPKVDYMGKPKVCLLHPNTFHGGGLLPWNSRNPFVIAPGVFSPTNWVQRRLSQLEFGNILDIPEAMQRSLSPPLLAKFLNDVRFIPERLLFQVLDCLNLDGQSDGKVEHGCPQKEGYCSLPVNKVESSIT